jgi:hypothetical protein
MKQTVNMANCTRKDTGVHRPGGNLQTTSPLPLAYSKEQNSNSDPSVVQPVGSRYTDYAIPARVSATGTIIN